ncbi:hypothetical protein ACFQ7F_31080 [Streptomyces sp. NPDC056486]|uniref:hypothetical protein n=1 Tax=Streptomyces sp. NPDC056486 TaxID=3345835 RepID=UPI00368C7DA6
MSEQLTRADLSSMAPEEIQTARRSGRLNALLNRPEATVNDILTLIERDQPPEPADDGAEPADDGQLSRADLADASPADIVKAKAEGRLDALLGRMA